MPPYELDYTYNTTLTAPYLNRYTVSSNHLDVQFSVPLQDVDDQEGTLRFILDYYLKELGFTPSELVSIVRDAVMSQAYNNPLVDTLSSLEELIDLYNDCNSECSEYRG